jgi:hypothetical protein
MEQNASHQTMSAPSAPAESAKVLRNPIELISPKARENRERTVAFLARMKVVGGSDENTRPR